MAQKPRAFRTLALVAVVAATAAVGATLLHYALLLWVHSYDEDVYRAHGLETLRHFPSSLWAVDHERGVQRLESWVIAAGLWLFDGPAAFRAIRVLNVALYCSTVIPVVLWARAMGVRLAVAFVAGVLAILVPWATVTAVFFTENPAYPAATWALYAMWAAATRPTWRRVALVAVAVFVALLARSVMIALPVVFVVTLVAVAVRFDLRSAWAARATWTPRQVVPWALLGAGALVAAMFYAFGRSKVSHQLGGSYTLDLDLRPGELWDIAKRSLARVVSGLGILPGVIALAWIGRTLWRPAGRDRFALAVLAVLTFLFVVYSAQRGGPDERYLIYLAPPLLVAAAVAVDRLEIGPVAVMVAAGLVVWLFAVVPWSADQHAYGFLVSSAEAFHARILLLSLGSHAPGVGLSYPALLALGVLGVAAIAAVALHRRDRLALGIGIALAVGVIGLQVAQMTYVSRHFQRETAWGPDLEGRAWVDRSVGGERAALLITNQNSAAIPLAEAVREVEFWNTKLDTRLLAPTADPRSLYGGASRSQAIDIDRATGRLIAAPGAPAIPRYLAQPLLQPVAPLAGRVVVQPGYEPFALINAGPAPRVQWQVDGVDAFSWSRPDERTAVRVYRGTDGPPPPGDCLDVGLSAPDELGTATRRLTVTSGEWRRTVTLRAQHPVTLKAIPLTAANADAFRAVRLDAAGAPVRLGDGRRTAFNMATVARAACPA
jgi:hypothetical protein